MSNHNGQKPGCLIPFLSIFWRGSSHETPLGKAESIPGSQDRPDEIQQPAAVSLPYRVRDNFLTPAELSFYHVLLIVLDGRATVAVKAGLAEIFFVVRPNENRAYYNQINQKHVDFLICDATSMQPIVAIELDDSSHNRQDRRERDEFVDAVYQAAGLPLLHIPAQHEYSTADLALRLAPFLPAIRVAEMIGVRPANGAAQRGSGVPLCRKCGVEMVLRVSRRRGSQQAEPFYGCPNYPRCREIVPLPDGPDITV